MPNSPLVSKIRCINPNLKSASIRNRNYVMYIATREGVDLTPTDSRLEGLLRGADTTGQDDSNNQTYLRYIHERPRSHGLFGNISESRIDDINTFSKEMYKLSKDRPVYRGIVSLSEADALNLGYNNGSKWVSLMEQTMPDIGRQFKIPIDKLEWVAAVHMEAGHPHLHYMFWRKDAHKVNDTFIHTSRQDKCREIFSKVAFEEERRQYTVERTQQIDRLPELAQEVLNKEVHELLEYIPGSGIPTLPLKINKDTLNHLSEHLLGIVDSIPKKGRLNYKFMPPDVKRRIDALSDEILKIPKVNKEFHKYLDAVNCVSDTYSVVGKKRERNLQKAMKELRTDMGNKIMDSVRQLKGISPPPFLSSSAFDKSIDLDAEPGIFPSEYIEPPFYDSLDSFYSGHDPSYDQGEPSYELLDDYYASYQDLLPNEPSLSPPSQHNDIEYHPFDTSAPAEYPSPYMKWNREYKAALDALYNKQDYKTAIKLLGIEADKGNILAMYDLGTIHLYGKGIAADAGTAESHFHDAYQGFSQLAEKVGKSGKLNSYLNYRLGKLHETGYGTPRNIDQAISYYKDAGMNKYAQYSLAKLYMNEYRPEFTTENKKYQEVINLLRSSSEQGNSLSSYALGRLYLDETLGFFDYDKAIDCLLESTALKNGLAFYQLGKLYYEGKYVSQNVNQAIEYLKSGIGMGNSTCEYLLAKIYSDDSINEFDIHKAVYHFEQAAGSGNALGYYQLGKIYYEEERYQMKDIHKAIHYLTKGSEAGNEHCDYLLGKLFSDVQTGHQNGSLAAFHFEKAALSGNAFAHYQLGRLYFEGHLVGQDTIKGMEHLISAASAGNHFAKVSLGICYLYGKHGLAKNETEGLRWLEEADSDGNVFARELIDTYHYYQIYQMVSFTSSICNQIYQGLINEQNDMPAIHDELKKELSKQARKEWAIKRRIHTDSEPEI